MDWKPAKAPNKRKDMSESRQEAEKVLDEFMNSGNDCIEKEFENWEPYNRQLENTMNNEIQMLRSVARIHKYNCKVMKRKGSIYIVKENYNAA